ncbi:MAG TPA: hypothetical protein VMX94_13230 [Armatimonadota bacterium]|nr:hypothetical protein [Armatimonadota bacterium]
MRFGRIGACIGLAAAYVTLRFAAPLVKPGFISPDFTAFAYTALLMLAQLAFVVSIAGLKMRPKSSALLMLPCALAVVATIFLEMKLVPLRPTPVAALVVSSVFRNLCLMLFGGSLGCLLSFMIREANILVPVAVFAALVDYWNVSWGPLSRVIERKPDIIATASVHMPAPGMPGGSVGVGDFVFLALFFAVLYRFSLNVRGAFWLGYGLLTACMLIVLKFGIPVPALVPMAIAVVGANVRSFKLRREELLAILYVGLLLLMFLLAWLLFVFKR